ncbi:MAG: SCO family protein, partial [Zetaproteobacteria bacterium]
LGSLPRRRGAERRGGAPMNRILVLLGLTVAAVAGGVAFEQHAQPRIPRALHGIGGDFAFVTAKGTQRLSDLRGRAVLLYFGYAHCPDACPAALSTIAAAIEKLSPQAPVQGLFISVDPARDTPQMLAQYARFFSERIIAGTIPDIRALRAAAARFRADFSYRTPNGRPDPDSDYAVDHTSFIYLITPDGRVAAMFDFQTSPDELARAVRAWIAPFWAQGGSR